MAAPPARNPAHPVYLVDASIYIFQAHFSPYVNVMTAAVMNSVLSMGLFSFYYSSCAGHHPTMRLWLTMRVCSAGFVINSVRITNPTGNYRMRTWLCS
jgi:hypothetical protein